jgi:hypothetical protein
MGMDQNLLILEQKGTKLLTPSHMEPQESNRSNAFQGLGVQASWVYVGMDPATIRPGRFVSMAAGDAKSMTDEERLSGFHPGKYEHPHWLASP